MLNILNFTKKKETYIDGVLNLMPCGHFMKATKPTTTNFLENKVINDFLKCPLKLANRFLSRILLCA